MVLLQLTDRLETRLRSLQLPPELGAIIWSHLDNLKEPANDDAQGNSDQVSSQSSRVRTIEHSVLVRVAQHFRSATSQSPCTLASLLALTDIHAPPLPIREKSPELLAILADIQLAQDRASYARMTQSTTAGRSVLFPSMDPSSHHDGVWTGSSNDANTAGDWKEIRRQITAIVNVIASMATVATGVWWVGGGRSVGARLGLAMSGAAAIAAIEAFLYYRFFTRHDRERAHTIKRRKAVAAVRSGQRTTSIPSMEREALVATKERRKDYVS